MGIRQLSSSSSLYIFMVLRKTFRAATFQRVSRFSHRRGLYDIEDDTVSSNNDEESTSDENPSFPDTSSSRGVISSFKAPPADYGEDESKTDVSHATPLNGITDDYGVDVSSKERQKSQGEDMLNFSETDEAENAVEATEYHDVLILFRFKDRDLPFKLKQIIMSDRRLLTLLEAGLPSWVIFLQSYPGFCHIYRPWMCPMARALYILISAVTVIIGFIFFLL